MDLSKASFTLEEVLDHVLLTPENRHLDRDDLMDLPFDEWPNQVQRDVEETISVWLKEDEDQ